LGVGDGSGVKRGVKRLDMIGLTGEGEAVACL
jgi:hypothetical protein